MKKNILTLLLLSASIATLLTACHADADVNVTKPNKPTTPSGQVCASAISGQLTESGSGLPIENALVTLEAGGAKVNTGTVRTDAKGTYRFPSIPCGDQYRVLATKAHYSVGEATVTANGNDILIGDIQMKASCFTTVTNDLNFGYNETEKSKIIKYECENSVDYSVATDQPLWITVITPSGKLNSGQSGLVIIRIDRSKLPNAVNNGYVTVNSLNRGEQTILVTAYK
jgi:Carboxypeptidase regulatory-like domain/Viral BACON domain